MKQATGHEDQLTLRPARAGDGEAVFEVTRLSAAGLARNHYSAEQIADWMGERTPSFYEDLIAHGRMVVAERGASSSALSILCPANLRASSFSPTRLAMALAGGC